MNQNKYRYIEVTNDMYRGNLTGRGSICTNDLEIPFLDKANKEAIIEMLCYLGYEYPREEFVFETDLTITQPEFCVSTRIRGLILQGYKLNRNNSEIYSW